MFQLHFAKLGINLLYYGFNKGKANLTLHHCELYSDSLFPGL